VRGRDAAGQPWSAAVPATPGDAPALVATWARAHLRDLEDRYATDPSPDRELERRIVETSLRFGVLCRFTAFVAADVRVVNEGGVVHRVLQPVEAPAGWTMLERAGLAAAAMPMASMSVSGLKAAGPFAGRVAGSRGRGGKLDAGLGSLPGGAGPGRPGRAGRRRSGGIAAQPLGGADLTPYRRRAAQLATLLESDRPLPGLGPPSRVPGLPTTVVGGDLGRRIGLVRVSLEALVADLNSVDAVEEEVRPLRDLASELVSLAAPAVPDGTRLERLRERALAVLRAFAAPGAAPAPSRSPDPGRRDPGFWRR
jgi:Ca-activated chloride channel family protein